MIVKHTLQERERELRSLIATPAGREELQELASDEWQAQTSGYVRYHLHPGPREAAGAD